MPSHVTDGHEFTDAIDDDDLAVRVMAYHLGRTLDALYAGSQVNPTPGRSLEEAAVVSVGTGDGFNDTPKTRSHLEETVRPRMAQADALLCHTGLYQCSG